jgi:hypothetical protein
VPSTSKFRMRTSPRPWAHNLNLSEPVFQESLSIIGVFNCKKK